MSDDIVIEEDVRADVVTRVEFEAERAAVTKLQIDRESLKAAVIAAGGEVPLLVSE